MTDPYKKKDAIKLTGGIFLFTALALSCAAIGGEAKTFAIIFTCAAAWWIAGLLAWALVALDLKLHRSKGVKIQYANINRNGDFDIITVYRPGYEYANSDAFELIDAPGLIDQAQALKFAQWHFHCEDLKKWRHRKI